MNLLRYAFAALALCFAASPAFALVCGTGGGCWWVGGTGTWDSSTTTHWASSSGGAGGVAVPSANDAVVFDGSSGGGTVTVAATINASNTIGALTTGAFTGTLDFSANNPSITTTIFTNGGTGTRTINLGSATFTLTQGGGSSPLSWTTLANCTCTTSGATIVFSGGGNIVANPNASQTWGTFSVTTANAILSFGQNPTVNNFLLAPSTGLLIADGTTLTIANAPTWAGTDATHPITLIDSGNGAGAGRGTIAIITGTISINWASITRIAFTGTSGTATNSFGFSYTGITVTGPSGGGGGHIIGG